MGNHRLYPQEGSTPDGVVMRNYATVSPHANMLGLYYLPVLYLAHETGLGFERASKGLRRAIEAGFCSYDDDSEMVWVHEMAAYQIGTSLSAGDKRCAGVRNEYESLPENPFLSVFYDKYQHHYHLSKRRGNEVKNTRGIEGASKPHGSQEQEQEQEQDQEQNKNLLRGDEKFHATPPGDSGTEPSHAQPSGVRPLSDGVPESPEFIRLPLNDGAEFVVTEAMVSEWAALYPAVDVRQQLRNQCGWLKSEPKRRKTARGVKKFITGWLAREQDRGGGWQQPVSQRRNINTISQPDTEIPPGFRG
ncbi:hypothetical protein IB70_04730 [Citrobacter braakii]|nr:hypothetical protein IB70_04730 [Citrobacter braakii]